MWHLCWTSAQFWHITLSLDLQEAPGGATMRSTTSFCNLGRLITWGYRKDKISGEHLESQGEWDSSIREDVASCRHVCQPSVRNMILWKIWIKTWCLIMSGVETLKGRLPSTLTLGISSSQSFLRTSGNSLAQQVIFDKQAELIRTCTCWKREHRQNEFQAVHQMLP